MVQYKHISQHSCSDDGLWVHLEKDDKPGFAYVICFEYWENLDSSAVEEYGKYNIQAGYVDLASDPTDALKFCGWELEDDGNIWCPYSGDTVAEKGTRAYQHVLVEAMWGYGQKDVVLDASGNNRRELFKQARNAL